MCKCVLPPGDNPTAVNKYIILLLLSDLLTNLKLNVASTTAAFDVDMTLV
jgi:hypothetical protein